MSADLDRLAELVDHLDTAYRSACAGIERDIKAAGYEDIYQPEAMKDHNGRYILLDALTALINAKAMLIRAGR